jgi:hypothetical protein
VGGREKGMTIERMKTEREKNSKKASEGDTAMKKRKERRNKMFRKKLFSPRD